MVTILIGPFPPKIGGDSRHMKDTIEYLNCNKINFKSFNISRPGELNVFIENIILFLKYIYFLFSTFRTNNKVILNCNEGGIVVLSIPLLLIYSKRNIKLRVFGGGILNYYNQINIFRKLILIKIINAYPKVYIQTLQSISGLKKLLPKKDFIHLPAGIQLPNFCKFQSHIKNKKFKIIYSGHFWKSKGLDLILSLSLIKSESIEIDLYGSLDEYDIKYIERFKVNYKGTYKHHECYQIFENYDLLILPTTARCEGYPGVILEAMAVGLPVLVSNWNAISEVVTNDRGILIDNISIDNILDAIENIRNNDILYKHIVKNAHSFAERFDFNNVIKILLND